MRMLLENWTFLLPGIIVLWEATDVCNAPLAAEPLFILPWASQLKKMLGTSFLSEVQNTDVLWFKYLVPVT